MNLFECPQPPMAGEEHFTTLLQRPGITVEHICSNNVSEGAWYDQAHDEWVVLLQGDAVLGFEETQRRLQAGECLLIPAHVRHRVLKCSQDARWLALHFVPSS